MYDREVSLRSVTACLLWVVGTVLAVLDLLGWIHAGSLGMVAAAAGATLNVRGFFAHLAKRERNAYEIGRDYERHRFSLVE